MPNGVPLKPVRELKENPINEQFLSERSAAERVKLRADFPLANERTPQGVASWGAFSLVLSFGTKRKYI